MLLSAGKGLKVHLERSALAGTSWIVRVERRRAFGSRVESSDWFLDETQARRFAESLARELRAGTPMEDIKARRPGWTLWPVPKKH